MSFHPDMTRKAPAGPVALCAGAILALACMTAQAAVYNPPILLSQGIEYMSGGIGSEEAELMRTVEPRWSAVFEFAVKDGQGAAFAADVLLTVRDAQGRVVLDHVRASGPYLVARLDPGKYSAEAVLGGAAIVREITVGGAGTSTRNVFEWPQGTDTKSARS